MNVDMSVDMNGDGDLSIDIAIPESEGASLDARLRNLAERLRADGRGDDAEIVTEALLALELR